MKGQYSASELQELLAENNNLVEELKRERQLRKEAEEDRLKVKRARDELARQVLLLEKRVSDAEDSLEQAHEELRTGTAPADQKDVPSPYPPQGQGGDDAKALHKDIEILLRELDRERVANAELVAVVEASHEEASRAAEQLVAAEKQIRSLKRSGGKFVSAPSSSDLTAAPELLHERIAALKLARDRLIEALDAQTEESERLLAENTALGEALLEVRWVAASWETQAQDGLAQCSHLKDLLEESWEWEGAAASLPLGGGEGGGEQGKSGDVEDGGTNNSINTDLAALCRKLEKELQKQQTRRIDLESQVAALCAELTRLAAASTGTQRAVLPVLCGVEARLVSLLKNKPKTRFR